MAGSEVPAERDVPLGPLTWFRVGGAAEVFARPRTPEELERVVGRARGGGMRLRVIGGGSNILVSDDGVRGMVVSLTAPPFKALVRTGDETVQCGAGANLARLVQSLADWGLTGGEGMAGIPGTVGGALCTNAGTSSGEIGPIVRRVWALEADGASVSLPGPECAFGYRSSGLGGKVLLGAELLASRGRVVLIRERMAELLAHRASTQPRGGRSAGCIFKNPPGTSAGKLLDELGLKGLQEGAARVSPVHANFIEAPEGATASDIKRLIDEMRRRALQERGVTLELQLELWGFENEP